MNYCAFPPSSFMKSARSQHTLIDSIRNSVSMNESQSDFLQNKLMENYTQKKPSASTYTLEPTSRPGTGKKSFSEVLTMRKSISQIDPLPDIQSTNYRITKQVMEEKRDANKNQKLEQLILSRIQSGKRTQEMQTADFTEYPDYYKDYQATMYLPVTKNMSSQNYQFGRKLVDKLNHKFFVSGMVPYLRPEKTPLKQYQTCLTSELDKAAADIAIKVHNMKLLYEGYAPKAIANNQDGELIQVQSTQGPQTLTERIAEMEEQNQDYIPSQKTIAIPKGNSIRKRGFRRGFQTGEETGGWGGHGSYLSETQLQ